MSITPEQLKELTDEPLLAVLATVNPSGTPQATPLWYHYDGECFVVTCYAHRVKVRNIRQNPNVVLVVVDSVNNGKGLIIRGVAEIVEEGAEEATVVNGIKYLGEERGREAAEGLNSMGSRVALRIRPVKIIYGD
ncbi:MAG: TIGR03618 family F420-dependent PPOX class oxidoreductase [Dehalococcoidia bacterium]|nr:TIGR03618 family F420-dependent PPOX class oxidoreductase [Dehalococcoidia bacterium]